MNRYFILSFLSLALIACQTTPDVTQAHDWERKAIVAYREDNRRLAEAFLSDLHHAWRKQVDLVSTYELQLRSSRGKIEVEQVTELLQGAQAKEAEIAVKIDAIRKKVDGSEVNYRIALRLHDGVGEWLGRTGISQDDQDRYLEEARELATQIKKKNQED